MNDIWNWLRGLGLEKYGEILKANDIDLDIAPVLTEGDLEQLGLSLGHRKKFLVAAASLRSDSARPALAPQASRSPQMERRQVTVAFTDLVGSTALAGELDPEELNRLLQSYRDACAAVIAKFDGYVAQYLGDGVLAYFGYPLAQEHAAERAVNAGLEMVRAVARLKRPDGQALESRVGISTGLVAAGAISVAGTSREQTVVGETPNLAARLQALAMPGCVLVGPGTYRLTTDYFDYSFEGEHQLKGFAQPVAVWRTLGERATESRFAATRSASAVPIIAREREFSFLLDAWRRAAQGNGHLVLVGGEAGMGKSRLLEALVEHLQGEPKRLLRCQCSPYYANSALYPFKQLLRRLGDLKVEALAADNLQRIAALLSHVGREDRSSILLVAELLEVPAEDSLSPMEMTPAQKAAETLAILEDFLLSAVDDAPVLVLLEDAHWSDPSTQSVVERILKRVEKERVLVLVTHRPEFKSGWAERAQATAITCKALGPEQCAVMVRQVAGMMRLDDALVEQIAARSDGVPLFVEELTKSVLEQNTLRGARVPETLQDSLMARLDRLGAAKEVAQIASVIGRQFQFQLLLEVSGAGTGNLVPALKSLQEAGLVMPIVGSGGGEFSFNHALVQEAAYDSLSRERCVSLHQRIARFLEGLSPGEADPALVAHHFNRAGDALAAYEWWMNAADRSLHRLAFAEAIANLGAALTQAERVVESTLRARMVLEVQLKLGATYIIRSGPQSDEGETALGNARRIAEEIGAGPQLFQAHWGLYLKAGRTRKFEQAREHGDALMAVSTRLADADLQYEGTHHRWGYAYFTGATGAMLDYSNEGIRLYDRARHHRLSFVFSGHDPCVCAHCVHALALAISGDSQGVGPVLDAGIALAESLQHPLSVAFALGAAAHASHLAGDGQRMGDFAGQLVRVATKYDFEILRKVGRFMLAASRAIQDDSAASLNEMEAQFEAAYGYGFMGVYPGVILADALSRNRRTSDASAVVSRMLAESSTPKVGISISEVWRMRAEFALAESAANKLQAKEYLTTALEIAVGQEAKIYIESARRALDHLEA